jgi:ASCH domain
MKVRSSREKSTSTQVPISHRYLMSQNEWVTLESDGIDCQKDSMKNNLSSTISGKVQNRALSICQPYAEMILRGIKTIEYRSRLTHIRGRVYIYASLTPGQPKDFNKLGAKPGDFPTGVLVGTVEIVGCKKPSSGDYHWLLDKPKRLAKPVKADNKARPSWFIPFKK